MIIRAFDPSEASTIRDLVTEAFGQEDEGVLCAELRDAGDMALELVAEHKRKIVGHVALFRMVKPSGWLALAALSIAPKHQKRGIGSALCQAALQFANAPVVVLGDPAFFSRHGFDFARAQRFETLYPISSIGLFASDLDEVQPQEILQYPAAFKS